MYPERPPQLLVFLKQCVIQSGTPCPESQVLSVLKNPWESSRELQLIRLQILIQMKSALWVHKRGLSNALAELPSPLRSDKYQNETKSWTGFLWCQLLPLSTSKPISEFRNEPVDPVSTTSGWGYEDWPLYCLVLHYWETCDMWQVTGTCWISPTRPLSTITLVVHPGDENHDLANNHT